MKKVLLLGFFAIVLSVAASVNGIVAFIGSFILVAVLIEIGLGNPPILIFTIIAILLFVNELYRWFYKIEKRLKTIIPGIVGTLANLAWLTFAGALFHAAWNDGPGTDFFVLNIVLATVLVVVNVASLVFNGVSCNSRARKRMLELYMHFENAVETTPSPKD